MIGMKKLGLLLVGYAGAKSSGVCSSKMVTTDRLFRSIEVKEEEYNAPNCISSWGRVLDAGTGDHSLNWLKTLPIDSLVAVTGDTTRAASLRKTFPESHIDILAGNWKDPSFLDGQKFDVVIADYLVGAIEGHAPYFQDQIFHRLYNHVADGGRLYVVGLQPITMSIDPSKPTTSKERVVLEMQRVRDACILLAGHRVYREYPVDWILRQLNQAGFQVRTHSTFPNKYSTSMMQRQIAVGRNKIQFFMDRELGATMEKYLDKMDLEAEEATRDGSFEFGFDYVVSARKIVIQ